MSATLPDALVMEIGSSTPGLCADAPAANIAAAAPIDAATILNDFICNYSSSFEVMHANRVSLVYF